MKHFGMMVALIALLFATACGGSTDGIDGVPGATDATSGGELTIFGSDPPTLDPALTGDTSSALYVSEIFSGLLTLNQQLQIVPDLAESWSVSPDGIVYRFILRDNIKFHNGRAVTAADFKYSIERAADPMTGSHTADTYIGDIKGVKEKLAGQVTEVSGVRVIDDKTIEIELEAPRFYFLAKLTYPTAFVVAKENVETRENWFDTPLVPVRSS